MAGAAGVTKDSVEAWTAVTDSGLGLWYITLAHLQHTSEIPTNEEVPPIWANVAASRTQSRGLALIGYFLGKGMDY